MTSFDAEKRKLLSGEIVDGLGRGLDPGLLPYINTINSNPDLMTIQSCSGMPYQGHAGQGHPYVSLKFRDRKSQNYYTDKLRSAGYSVSGDDRDSYVEIPNTTTMGIKMNKDTVEQRTKILSEYYSPSEVKRVIASQQSEKLYGRLATPQECRQFWNTVTTILRTPMP